MGKWAFYIWRVRPKKLESRFEAPWEKADPFTHTTANVAGDSAEDLDNHVFTLADKLV